MQTTLFQAAKRRLFKKAQNNPAATCMTPIDDMYFGSAATQPRKIKLVKDSVTIKLADTRAPIISVTADLYNVFGWTTMIVDLLKEGRYMHTATPEEITEIKSRIAATQFLKITG